MTAYSEDHIALAAEYALGTLDADERIQVETMMAVDRDFAAVVQAWEFRLGVLNQMVGSVEPRPIVWESIQASIAKAAAEAPPAMPDAPAEAPLEQPPPSYDAEPQLAPLEPSPAAIGPAPVADNANVIQLSGQLRRWRGIARVASALAAALIALLAIEVFQPDLLPSGMRPKPRTEIVEVKTPPQQSTAQYVALLQGQGGGPAFILTVDGATRNFTVRRVGAPAADPGKSFELWLISDKLGRPRSLGVIGSGEFTGRNVLASYDADVINAATYAVTVEQAGGSPDGNPHSAPVYSGKLIETVPPAR
ncbi:anti-sigma factor [Bradyrhizobium sp. NP1]|uniref:anti-sigma factor n=1 Tax=Bradyrhizobium sp. NP1 TaxID=3049772 RepID=UPI0025A60742|nr:anti-sigma factor [Bradyrhizobium sp. NP1]WJR77336.1 anti-sigma factor [Bradyrhizobium sp. NP1]